MDAGTVMQNFSSFVYEADNDAEKVYVRRKFNLKFIKICSFIAGIVTALLLTTIIMISTSTHLHSHADVYNDKLKSAPGGDVQGSTDFSGQLLVSLEDNNLWTMDPESQRGHIIPVNANDKLDSFEYDYRKQSLIFLSENRTEFKSLQSRIQPWIKWTLPRKLKPSTFRIDELTGNLYAIDPLAETVSVIDAKNGLSAVLTSRISSPQDLVLDPSEGIMFIASRHRMIWRVGMNGEDLELVLNGSYVSALAVDRELKHLYFAVDWTGIESVNYAGERRASICKLSTAVGSLATLNGSLYWTAESRLWSCRIEESTYGPRCKDGRPAHHPQATLRGARVVRAYPPPARAGEPALQADPCREPNPCQHLCLLAPAKAAAAARYSCACAVGWRLDSRDGKSCEPVLDYLLYAIGSHVRARDLEEAGDGERRAFVDVVYPTEFHVESLQLKHAIDFDYDARADRLFFSDDYNLYAMRIKAEAPQQKKLVHVGANYNIKELAYDWQSGNLYYVKRSMSSSYNHEIVALRYTDKLLLERTVHSLSYESSDTYENCPYSLLVLPDAGSLFYTAYVTGSKDIQKFSIVDKVRNTLKLLPFVNAHRTMAIDYADSTLYFRSFRYGTSTNISSMNYDASNEKASFTVPIPHMISMYVHRQWLYFSNEIAIWRVDKRNGSGLAQLIEKSDSRILSPMRIVSPAIQTINTNNPCAFDNGGCKQFCFASCAKKECRCTVETEDLYKYC